jgi:putative ABC transport system ATP-binding protein
MSAEPAVDIRDLAFNWPKGPAVLQIAALRLLPGETLFLRGGSGSGKSTLLGIISGVLAAREGVVRVLGNDLRSMSGARRDALRASQLGVIFQLFNLLPYLSVIDNVMLPCGFSRVRAAAADARGGRRAEARRLLAHLGVGADLWNVGATALSVGQQQRVAVARALIGAPPLILADEPTSALDAETRDSFIQLLKQECAASRSSLVFVSHDVSLATHFDHTMDMKDINTAAGKRAA